MNLNSSEQPINNFYQNIDKIVSKQLSSYKEKQLIINSYIPRKKHPAGMLRIYFFSQIGQFHSCYEQLIKKIFDQLKNTVEIHFLDYLGHGESLGEKGFIPDLKYYEKDALNFITLIDHKFGHNLNNYFLGDKFGASFALKLIINNEHFFSLYAPKLILIDPWVSEFFLHSSKLDLIGRLRDTPLKLLLSGFYFNFDANGINENNDQNDLNDFLNIKTFNQITGESVINISNYIKDILSLSYFNIFPTKLIIKKNNNKKFKQKKYLISTFKKDLLSYNIITNSNMTDNEYLINQVQHIVKFIKSVKHEFSN